MKCVTCKAEIPQRILAIIVDDVLQSGGDLESLSITECPNCVEKETKSEPV